jgi:hypothetical protein
MNLYIITEIYAILSIMLVFCKISLSLEIICILRWQFIAVEVLNVETGWVHGGLTYLD